jgi:3-isopropylmalate/(R)-2-methylmalate dehydratase small subunit
VISGRCWTFGDNVNTDLIQPMHALFKPVEEQRRYVFEANRPGWVDEVEPGDVLIAGANFGTGSSRPAARVLKELGLGGLICESANTLFFRNSVNFAFPTLECPGVAAIFAEGDEASFDLATGEVVNRSNGERLTGRAWRPELMAILDAGGILQQLHVEGLLIKEPS